MTERRNSGFQNLIQHFAVTRAGSWFFAHFAHHLDRLYLRLSGGRRTLVSIVSGLPALVLSTTGAKSGLPRTTPLVYIHDPVDPCRLALIASNLGQQRNPAWYYNLRTNPRAVCSINGSIQTYIAREAQGEEYEHLWQTAVEVYFGYQYYKEQSKRHIPIMVLEREQ